MFDPINIPFGAKMLFNVVELKKGVSLDAIEMAIGEMCNTVKNTYGNDEGGLLPDRCLNSQDSFPRRARYRQRMNPQRNMKNMWQ